MTDSPTSQPNPPEQKIKIPVHQQKSGLFRVVHADGVWWSVNPWNNLHLAFYSERAPIPQVVYFGQDESGKWIELQEEREGKTGWFREMEVDVSLTLNGAYAVLDAINQYIKHMETVSKSQSPPKSEEK